MIINLDENIIQLKKYKGQARNEKIQMLSHHFAIKFKAFTDVICVDRSKINTISIIPFSEDRNWFGRVEPTIKNDSLCLDVFFVDIVLYWSDDKQHKNHTYADGVIAHEFYHCQEILTTSRYIDYKKLFTDIKLDTTRKYIIDFARSQFSEYYAYYFSSKIYSKNLDVNFEKEIYKSWIALYALRDYAKTNKDVILIEDFKNDIEAFIVKSVKQIARYHSTDNEEYLHILDKYKTSDEYNLHYKYFIKLSTSLKDMFSLYPQEMSEDFLLKFGKILLYILNLYSLDYSTNDLSDNFVFVYRE